ncbi:MAG: hypothetical protein K6G83_10655 [Lachnospiraceae bacterium]|nr:hypothetical protein [Lachnospiraceae bacterium]
MKKRSDSLKNRKKTETVPYDSPDPGRTPKRFTGKRIATAVIGAGIFLGAAFFLAQRINTSEDTIPRELSPAYNIVINDDAVETESPEIDIRLETASASEDTKIESTEESTELSYKENAGKGYLNRCVFLGDSRTVAMVNYGFINDDEALAQIGISHTSFKTNTFVNNAGKEYTLKSYLASHQSPVIYIALGVNGINDPSEEHYESTFIDLIDTVMEQAPYSNVVLMSIGPVDDNGAYRKTVQNAWIEKYNEFLKQTAEEKHIFYLNVSEVLTGPNGQVKPEYDGGDGLHYTSSGCDAIFHYIYEHPVPGISDEGEYVVHYVKPRREQMKVTMDEGSGIDEKALEELMNLMLQNAGVLPTDTPALNPEQTVETPQMPSYELPPEPVPENPPEQVEEPQPEPEPEPEPEQQPEPEEQPQEEQPQEGQPQEGQQPEGQPQEEQQPEGQSEPQE